MRSNAEIVVDALEKAGVKIVGPSPASIALAEDREQFARLLEDLEIAHPEYGITRTLAGGHEVARRIGYPVIIKASAGGGGRGMRVAENESELIPHMRTARAEAEAAFRP